MEKFLIVFQALFFLASTLGIIMGGVWAMVQFKQAREDHQKKMEYWDKKIDEISQRIDPLKIKKQG